MNIDDYFYRVRKFAGLATPEEHAAYAARQAEAAPASPGQGARTADVQPTPRAKKTDAEWASEMRDQRQAGGLDKAR